VFLVSIAYARDDGRYADSPLHSWFDSLASKKGSCCSFADGISIQDVDWDTKDGHYRVKVPSFVTNSGPLGKGVTVPATKDYIVVPDDALITGPNRLGPAVVWPWTDSTGAVQIRCFMPGAGG
jgi:hypothetical protein